MATKKSDEKDDVDVVKDDNDADDDEPAKASSDSSSSNKTILRVAVGTTNPCKIDSVKLALSKALATMSPDRIVELQVDGFSVESGVADQPFGDEETQTGAKNRAENAHRAYRKQHGVFPHLSVGLEGGLDWSTTVLDDDDEQTLWCMAWMSIYGRRNALVVDLLACNDSKFYVADKKPIHSLAKTGSFLLPSALAKLVQDGMELGHADDKLFGRTNAKQHDGTVGYLTNSMIDRSTYYEHALTLALVPWIRPDVYGTGGTGIVSGLFCSSGGR